MTKQQQERCRKRRHKAVNAAEEDYLRSLWQAKERVYICGSKPHSL